MSCTGNKVFHQEMRAMNDHAPEQELQTLENDARRKENEEERVPDQEEPLNPKKVYKVSHRIIY